MITLITTKFLTIKNLRNFSDKIIKDHNFGVTLINFKSNHIAPANKTYILVPRFNLLSNALKNKNAEFLTQNVKSALPLYQKFNGTMSTICVESFMLVSKSARKAPFLALCCSTM